MGHLPCENEQCQCALVDKLCSGVTVSISIFGVSVMGFLTGICGLATFLVTYSSPHQVYLHIVLIDLANDDNASLIVGSFLSKSSHNYLTYWT